MKRITASAWAFAALLMVLVPACRGFQETSGETAGGDKPLTLKEGHVITPCPASPNCVSSVDTDRRHFIDPFRYAGSLAAARQRLLRILEDHRRIRVVDVTGNTVRAEAVSAVWRFVDDMAFVFDDAAKVVHLKSASRKGYTDLGVNRRRLERIRWQFETRNRE